MESIRIEGSQLFQSVFVSAVDNLIWVNLQHGNGSAYLHLTLDRAEDLIKALQQSIEYARDKYEAKEEARIDALFDARYSEEDE